MIILDWIIVALNLLVVLALGAAIGSFLNVVIYRVPAGRSILFPASHCPICNHSLSKADNIPILGWIFLKGKCRYCQTSISPRYPLVEAFTAIVFLITFWQFDWSLQTVGYWIFLSWLIALALIDFDTMTLPNILTSWGLLAGFSFQLASLVFSDQPTNLFLGIFSAIFSAILGLWLFDLIAISGTLALGKPAMGGGDAKLAAMIGAWLGWKLLLVTSFVASALGAFLGGGAIALKIIDRNNPMPFGPFLALGAGLALLWGDAIVGIYLKLFFPGL